MNGKLGNKVIIGLKQQINEEHVKKKCWKTNSILYIHNNLRIRSSNTKIFNKTSEIKFLPEEKECLSTKYEQKHEVKTNPIRWKDK